MTKIGTLRFLRRYPVKSFKGEDLARAFVSFSGVAGDRVYAFVDPAKTGNFPWVTARQIPEMILFEPRFVDEQRFELEVKTPDGQLFMMNDPKLLPYLEKRWNRPLILRFSEKSMQDSRPLSIFGLSTLKQLENEIGFATDPQRFRANFLIEWEDPSPFFEESLIGKPLQIGEKLKIMITKKDSRCVIINLEPATAKPSPEVLKTVGKLHGGNVGVYAVTLQEGIAAAGDSISLVDI